MKKNYLFTKSLSRTLAVAACTILAMSMLTGCGGNESKTPESGSEAESDEKTQVAAEIYRYICSWKGVGYFANSNEEIVQLDGVSYSDSYMYHNVANVRDADYNHYLVDVEGNKITEPGAYEYIDRANEEYFKVEKDNLWGIIDYTGKVIIPVEYDGVSFETDDTDGEEAPYFIVEMADDKYAVYSEAGLEIFRSDERIDDYEIYIEKAYTSDSCDTLFYKVTGKLYNMETGKELLTGLTDGYYRRHTYISDGTMTIYDAKFNEKKVVEDFSYISTEFKDGIVVYNGKTDYYLTTDYELKEYVEKTTEKDDSTHTLANGDVYTSKVDGDAKMVYIYDKSGKEVYKLSYDGWQELHGVYACGNFIMVSYGNIEVIDPAKGEVILEDVDYFQDNEVNDLVTTSRGSGSSSERYVICHNNVLLKHTNTEDVYMNINGFWINDRTNDTATQYNLDGEMLKTIDNVVQVYQLEDNCMLLGVSEGNCYIVDKYTGDIIFELPITKSDLANLGYIPYTYDNKQDNIGIIQLSDGIYNLHGEKLVDLTAE